MSEITKQSAGGAVAALSNLRKGIQNAKAATLQASRMPILRMGKDGKWIYGQDNIEVEENARWAINPLSIQHGFVCWSDRKDEGKNELLGEVYTPLRAAPIDPKTLPDKGYPWKAATCIQLKCVSGEDINVEVVYKPSSKGGLDAVHSLLVAIEKQLDTETEAVVPVVVLTNSHYTHKSYGKTYVPVLDIFYWFTMEGPPIEVKAEPEQADLPWDEAESEQVDQEDAPPAPEEAVTRGRTRRRRRN